MHHLTNKPEFIYPLVNLIITANFQLLLNILLSCGNEKLFMLLYECFTWLLFPKWNSAFISLLPEQIDNIGLFQCCSFGNLLARYK